MTESSMNDDVPQKWLLCQTRGRFSWLPTPSHSVIMSVPLVQWFSTQHSIVSLPQLQSFDAILWTFTSVTQLGSTPITVTLDPHESLPRCTATRAQHATS